MEMQTRKFIPKSVRLMDQVREVLRFHHYAYNTVIRRLSPFSFLELTPTKPD
jgi:hypothetical protein